MPTDPQEQFSSRLQNIDYYCVFRDVMRNLFYIILGAIACCMVATVISTEQYNASYTTSATFVVSTKGSSNYAYSNLSAASTSATTFSNILNSSIMQQMVCDDLGLKSFDATAKAEVIEETNLLVLSVTADSPYKAYSIIRSIMDNYSSIEVSLNNSSIMEVLEEPEVPSAPDSRLSTTEVVKRVFVYGILLFAVLFVMCSIMTDTVRNDKDVDSKLDAKALGTIYYEKKHKAGGVGKKRNKSGLLVSSISSSFSFVESYKKIAARLTYTLPDSESGHQCRVIVVTSVLENEGKSTVAANIALTMVQNPARVLLIDGDLRKPAQHLLFGKKVDNTRTLPALLNGRAPVNDVLQYDKANNLYLLLAGQHYSNSTEIISGARMRRLLEVFRKHFDYIIIDTPPLSLMADAEVLADQADMSVLVSRYNYVQAEDINDAIDTLNGCNSELAGVVLNQARASRFLSSNSSYGYGYGYGRYGHYGRYGYGAYAKNARKSTSSSKGGTRS